MDLCTGAQTSCSQLEALKMEPHGDLVSDCLGICDEMHNTWHTYTITEEKANTTNKNVDLLTYQRDIDTTFNMGFSGCNP